MPRPCVRPSPRVLCLMLRSLHPPPCILHPAPLTLHSASYAVYLLQELKEAAAHQCKRICVMLQSLSRSALDLHHPGPEPHGPCPHSPLACSPHLHSTSAMTMPSAYILWPVLHSAAATTIASRPCSTSCGVNCRQTCSRSVGVLLFCRCVVVLSVCCFSVGVLSVCCCSVGVVVVGGPCRLDCERQVAITTGTW